MTTGVGALSPAEVDEALDRGAATAEGYRRRGLIVAAALFLNRESRPCGNVASASDVITEPKDPTTSSGSAPLPHIRGGEERRQVLRGSSHS